MKIRNLDLTRNPINVEHQQLGLPPVEEPVSHPETHPLLRTAMWFIVLVLIALILFLTGRFFLSNNWIGGWQIIGDTLNSRVFWSAVVVGFFAQVVDGALGMAHGVTATTFLLAPGASPGAASASVLIVQIFTTGGSGMHHAKFGHVHKRLFVRLLVPGILGGILGAILVAQIDGAIFKPYISTYLLLLGIYILSKAFRPLRLRTQPPRHVGKLALLGGLDDAGGGVKVGEWERRGGGGVGVGPSVYFGDKYCLPLELGVAGQGGSGIVPEMGSYGVGVSRLVGAVIEAFHDDAGIIWPDSVAPFRAAILNLKQGDANCDRICDQAYAHFGADALYDDREDRAGVKFADADLMGHPWQIVVGPRGAAAGTVELKRRATGERHELSLEAALAKIG